MIEIKRGDTGFGLELELSNDNGIIDLSNAKVYFLFGIHKIPCIIENAKKGIVHVFLNHVHTETSGWYNGEVEVNFKHGGIETYPNNEYIKLNITRDIRGVRY